MSVHVRVGATHLDIATVPRPGRDASVPTIVARHRMAPAGAGATVRDEGHVTALTQAALAAFTTEAPHRSKQRRPPSPAARAEADRLRRELAGDTTTRGDTDMVVDLARYAAAAAGRNTLPPRPTDGPSPEDQPNTNKETNHQ